MRICDKLSFISVTRHYCSLQCHMIFRNHNNMLISAQETFLIIINIENSCAAQYFVETDTFYFSGLFSRILCNIITVFTITFDKCIVSLINKSILKVSNIYIYVCVCVCVYVYTHTHRCMHARTHTHTHTHTRTHTHTHTHTHARTHTHAGMHARTHTHIYISAGDNCIQNKGFVYICVYTVYIYYVYIKTHTYSIYFENITCINMHIFIFT